jgi:hypothetical protein
LLADFVAHVPVVRVQFFKLRGEGVNVLERELGLVERPHDVENIKRPAARVNFVFFKRPKAS